MLDSFLEVAYNSDQKKQQAVKLASSLKNLPNDQLFALATGKAKLAFHHDEEWLEKYRGTPLFQEAMALEKADLENEVARTQASAAQPQMDQFWKTQDQIRIQKKMLDLKLVESEESGGMGLQDGGKLPEVVPATAQGAGALGDMPSEGAQQGEIGMQGAKVASLRFQVAMNKVALSGAALGGLIGSGVGALGGAMTGGSKNVVGPDGQVHKTESHRLRNALIGAGAGGVAGAGIGHGVGKLRGAGQTAAGAAKQEAQAAGHVGAPSAPASAGAVEPPKPTGYIPEDKPLFSASQFEPKKSVSPEDLPLREHIQMMGGNAPAAAKPDLSEIMNLPGGGLQPLQTPVAAPAAAAAPALDLSGTGIPQKELSAVGFQQAKRPGIFTRMFSPAQARFENAVADMGVKQAHDRMSLSMQKAALDMGALKSMGGKALEFARKNPGAVGAGLGAVTGALTAKRDPQTGEKHWVRGALGGAALGGAAGHVVGGIGNRLAQPGTSLGQAASGYAGDVKSKFQAGFDKLKNWTPVQAQPAQAAQPVQQSLPGIA